MRQAHANSVRRMLSVDQDRPQSGPPVSTGGSLALELFLQPNVSDQPKAVAKHPNAKHPNIVL